MTEDERQVVEAQISRMLAASDHASAISAAIRTWGEEILGFLAAVTGSEDHAGEIFLMFSEDLCRYAHTYRGDATFRSWCYAVARTASRRYYRRAANQARRHVPMSQAGEVMALAIAVRTNTLPYLRTQVKDAFRALRDELDPRDQEMLILRVDRDMSWNEVALALHDGEAPMEAASTQRSAAALRKRFERVKVQLHSLATERGLLNTEPE